jgi:hypothetical protein
MRIVRALQSIFPDESLVGVHPTLSPFPSAGWLRRSNYFTGRAVSHLALAADRDAREGRLALFGQGLAHGIVAGLGVELEGGSTPRLRIAPGLGVTVRGEDVTLTRELSLPFADVPVWPSGEVGALGSSGAHALVLVPVIEERTTGADEAESSGTFEIDPEVYSYEDRVHVDAARLYRLPLELGVEPGPRYRSELAHALFERERTRPVWELPWLLAGLPIALVAWSPELSLFVDRHAIARRAGGARAPRLLARKAGRAPLWQARVEQFGAELAGAGAAVFAPHGLARRFRWLPPIATLPADALSLRGPGTRLPSDDPLPPYWSVRALPIEFEALDDVYEASAALAPLDLLAREQVDVLVPVPGAWFDPRLLIVEQVATEFYASVYRFRVRLAALLAARGLAPDIGTARGHHSQIVRLLGAKPPVYPAELDPVPDETTPPGAPAGVDPITFPVALDDLSASLRAELTELRAAVDAELGPGQIELLLSRLGKPLGERPTPIDPSRPFADEFGGLGLDGFLGLLEERVNQSDDRLDALFLRVHADVYRIKQRVAGNTSGTVLATSPALAEVARRVVAAPSTESLASFAGELKRTVSSQLSLRLNVEAGAVAGDTAPLFQPLFAKPPKIAATELDLRPVVRQIMRQRPVTDILIGGLLGGVHDTVSMAPPPPAIVYQTSIVQRFATPPAPESQRFALDTKVAALRLIADTHEGLGLPLTGLMLPGFRDDAGAPVTRGIDTLVADNRGLIVEVASGEHDRVNGEDEAAYYAAAAGSMEDAVALLRLLEGRLAVYRRLEQLCSDARGRIAVLQQRAEQQLARIDDELAEARHDVRVGELLTQEEERRIAALNQRRDDIIAQHAPFLVLARPRSFDPREALPAYALEPGNVPDPVPACLNGHFEAPDQLREFVDLFSDAPIGWFAELSPWLDRLNRIDALHQTLKHAVLRARTLRPEARAPFSAATLVATPLGQRIQQVFGARVAVVQQSRAAVATLDLESVARPSWSEARRDAERVVSLGDLIDAKHGRQDASRAAAAELEKLYDVAACLFAHFRDVPPVLRLGWAERYSQFDDPPDFRQIEGLEGFQELERTDRRELQRIVAWLFQRVKADVPEAVALINDLVRVALLLASHAPVNQLLEADVIPGQTASVGGNLRLSVDVSRARVGMHVALFGTTPGLVVARGVVTDLGAGAASVRVLSATGPQVSPSRAQLSEPSRNAAEARGSVVQAGVAGLFAARRERA